MIEYDNLYYENTTFEVCKGPVSLTTTKATLHPNTKIIEKNAFLNSCIKEINLNEGLRVIEFRSFCNCMSLKSIAFPSTLQKIEAECFAGDKNLENVSINSELKRLGNACFTHCEKLKEINLEKTNLNLLEPYTFESCYNLQRLILPKNVKELSQYFLAFTNVSEIKLPDSLVNIWPSAFADSKVTRLLLPKNINGVSGAFSNHMKEIIYQGDEINAADLIDMAKLVTNKITVRKARLDDLIEDKSFKEMNKIYKENENER